VSLRDFLQDFDLSINKLMALHPGVLAAVAQLADLDDAQLSELTSWTGVPQAGVRMAYRGEEIVSRAIRSPEVRGCPACLRDDALGVADPLVTMAMRGDWLLRHSLVCRRHERLLVPLWTATRPVTRYDTQARLSDILPSVLDGSVAQASIVPSPFDCWLNDRLQAMDDTTRLGEHSLNVVSTMCKLLGDLILGPPESPQQLDQNNHLHNVYAAGFKCMSGGRGAVEDFLDYRLTKRGPADGATKVFGALYRKLGDVQSYDTGFDPFREMVRERVLNTWPIAAGETVLGKVVSKRRLHSIASLAQETGLKERTLRPRLVAGGIVDRHDGGADARVIFSAEAVTGFAFNMAGLTFLSEVRREMGATEAQVDGLVAEGLIQPQLCGSGMRRVWAVEDGLAIIERLTRRAVPIQPEAAGWEHVQDAAHRMRAPLAAVFRGIEEGKVAVGCRSDGDGYGAICVSLADVERLFPRPFQIGLSPSAFGVSVGVKAGGAIKTLIDQGYMTVTELKDARTGVVHQRILDRDAESFHARFYSYRTATAETDLSWRRLQVIFRVHGVAPFATLRETVEGVFEKDRVNAAVQAHRQSGKC